MTTETPETTAVVTELPAPSKNRFRNPFAKSETTETTEETLERKHRAPRGAVKAGLVLLVAGVGMAIGWRLGAPDDEDDALDVPTDTESTDN
jgi:hypothetical protein